MSDSPRNSRNSRSAGTPRNPKVPDYLNGTGDTVRIGLCQVFTRPWDLEGNTGRAASALQQAAEEGAELAVTPECVIHGYAFGTDETGRSVADIAETVDGPHLSAIREVVRSHGIHAVVGFAERGEAGAVHNTVAVISRDGSILDTYRKVHCRDFESIHGTGPFTPGERFTTMAVELGGKEHRIGPMICFDREFPETVRCLRALGASFIACPLATDTERIGFSSLYAHDEMITQVRAAENELFIAVANHAGRCNGGSFLVGPGGELLEQLGADAEVRVTAIPLDAVTEQFWSEPYSWKGWAFRRQCLYEAYLTH